MKKKRKKTIFILIIFLYILAAPEREGSSFKFNPVWGLNISDRLIDGKDSDFLVPFKNRETLGYFNFDGKLAYVEDIYYGAAQSDEYFINYSRVNESLLLKNVNTGYTSIIKTGGYPVLKNNRLFVISDNRKKISEWSFEGEPVYSLEKESEITSFDANNEDIIAGFVNGALVAAGKDKGETEIIKPAISRIDVVYGAAISPDSGFIAFISGIDPQYLMIMNKKNSQYKRFDTYKFSENPRHSRALFFTGDSRYLYFAISSRFYCYDLNRKNLVISILDEKITDIVYSEEKGIFFMASRKEADETAENNNIFYALYPDGRILYTGSFSGKDVFLELNKSRLFIGSDNYIFAVDIEYE